VAVMLVWWFIRFWIEVDAMEAEIVFAHRDKRVLEEISHRS
jgi:hypothetical protein